MAFGPPRRDRAKLHAVQRSNAQTETRTEPELGLCPYPEYSRYARGAFDPGSARSAQRRPWLRSRRWWRGRARRRFVVRRLGLAVERLDPDAVRRRVDNQSEHQRQ